MTVLLFTGTGPAATIWFGTELPAGSVPVALSFSGIIKRDSPALHVVSPFQP